MNKDFSNEESYVDELNKAQKHQMITVAIRQDIYDKLLTESRASGLRFGAIIEKLCEAL